MDCDGVLSDTERYGHLRAFNQTFRETVLSLRWTEETYLEKLSSGGGKERIASELTEEFISANNLPRDAEALRGLVAASYKRKTEIYTPRW